MTLTEHVAAVRARLAELDAERAALQDEMAAMAQYVISTAPRRHPTHVWIVTDIRRHLATHGPMSCEEIAVAINQPRRKVSRSLTNGRRTSFSHLPDGRWELRP